MLSIFKAWKSDFQILWVTEIHSVSRDRFSWEYFNAKC